MKTTNHKSTLRTVRIPSALDNRITKEVKRTQKAKNQESISSIINNALTLYFQSKKGR